MGVMLKQNNYRLFTGSKGQLCYWHWLEIDPIKLALVSTRIKQGSLDIVDYGTIIKSGVGNNPPSIEEVLSSI